ncbi:hypothetical protein Lfu02_00040 [Longispora fulva]|nr:hypothetical protein Lfu02_00040 [Longispora fulva]
MVRLRVLPGAVERARPVSLRLPGQARDRGHGAYLIKRAKPDDRGPRTSARPG